MDPTYGRAKAGRPARTYIQQLCEDTGYSPEDLPEAMNDRESGERGSGISVLAARHDNDDDDNIYIVNCSTVIYHHHHVALVARISLTLSRHSSLSFITLGRSSGQHSVSSHSCWMHVRAGRPAFARPCVGVHKSTSLMSSYLLTAGETVIYIYIYIYKYIYIYIYI